MYFRLENKESQKAQEIGNLIRVYNRSKREKAESEPLNLYGLFVNCSGLNKS